MIIMGEPKGKGRPRFANRGKFVTTYTDRDTLSYENLCKVCYKEQDNKYYEFEQLKCSINAYYSIPKSISKLKRQKMLGKDLRPTKKPDCDNVAKIILDALNKVAYKDDTQIVSLSVNKYYAEVPRVEVIIEEIK